MNDQTAGEHGPFSVRFDPGEGVAIVGAGTACLVLDDPHSELVTRLREVLSDPAESDAALEVMVRTSGLDLPPFGLVTVEDARARVVVRGQVGIAVRTVDGELDIVGEHVRTWVERVIDDVLSVTVVLDSSSAHGAGDPAFDASAGLLPASRVQIFVDPDAGTAVQERVGDVQAADLADLGVDSDSSVIDPPDSGWRMADAVEAAERAEVADQAHSTDLHGSDETPDPDAQVDAELWSDDASSSLLWPTAFGAVEPVVVEPVVVEPVDVESEVVEPVAPESGVVDPSDVESHPPTAGSAIWYTELDHADADAAATADPEPMVDHNATLVGPFDVFDEAPDEASVSTPELPPPYDQSFEPMADAGEAVEADPSASDDYDHLFGATQYRTVEQAAVRPEDDLDAADGVLGSGMISGVPTGDPGAAQPAAPSGGALSGSAPAGQPDGDHDGHTVSLASLRAQLEKSAPTPGSTPSVHAVHCPAGHLNPTHAGACRVCGAGILDQAHVSVPRPVLGCLVFTDGRMVTVDRPLLIGRAPKLEGVLPGEAPEMVAVTSPLKEVSSTHLEVRLEGWQVLVVDRQSTNGTVVTAPGRDPQRLRPGEPVPVTPGTHVNLADEVMFTFEVEA